MPVFVPTLRLFEVPDQTSQIQCSRQEILLHERISCSITPMIEGKSIITLSRSFTVSADSTARVDVIQPVLLDDISSSRGKNKDTPPVKLSIYEGSLFRFGYTALKVSSKRTRSKLSWSVMMPHLKAAKEVRQTTCLLWTRFYIYVNWSYRLLYWSKNQFAFCVCYICAMRCCRLRIGCLHLLNCFTFQLSRMISSHKPSKPCFFSGSV